MSDVLVPMLPYHHSSSRLRRYLSRPYLYPLLFLLFLFLLIRWHSQPNPGTTGSHFDNIMMEYSGEIVENNQIRPPADEIHKHVIQKPPFSEESDAKKTTLRKKANEVSLTVYMEAQCPDTTGFIRRQLLPAWSRLGSTNRIKIDIVPFGKASCVQTEDDYSCQCQHGKDECEMNQLMNCAMELLSEPDSYIPLIGCIQGKDNLGVAFKNCLDGHSSSDWLWQCAVGKHGRMLHARAGNRTASIGAAFNFVPWVVLDGKRNHDAFYALEENLCKRLGEPNPTQCLKFARR